MLDKILLSVATRYSIWALFRFAKYVRDPQPCFSVYRSKTVQLRIIKFLSIIAFFEICQRLSKIGKLCLISARDLSLVDPEKFYFKR